MSFYYSFGCEFNDPWNEMHVMTHELVGIASNTFLLNYYAGERVWNHPAYQVVAKEYH